MKVLFIGEGPHELGHGDFQFSEPRQAGGILPALACKMCEWITEPVALRWTDLARFNPNVKRSGLAAKVAAAVLLSARRFECQGTVCVCDRDRDDSRLPAMEEGRNRGLAAIGDDDFPVACGVAVESIAKYRLWAAPRRPNESNCREGIYAPERLSSRKSGCWRRVNSTANPSSR